eukprot:CAMPEP_0117446482 /NCGR_PEP_ID=MMETSP0759-20121206/6364_1 /TAXON_ID=63605 /ORGANISM="Percolomonas cosmopolitus, Strain WS" /LENGTH=256 /DNA_ID=CAMNT_0005238751 /DNA_START=545 /DNA_END=1315 /DNA_ORIENTATION=+
MNSKKALVHEFTQERPLISKDIGAHEEMFPVSDEDYFNHQQPLRKDRSDAIRSAQQILSGMEDEFDEEEYEDHQRDEQNSAMRGMNGEQPDLMRYKDYNRFKSRRRMTMGSLVNANEDVVQQPEMANTYDTSHSPIRNDEDSKRRSDKGITTSSGAPKTPPTNKSMSAATKTSSPSISSSESLAAKRDLRRKVQSTMETFEKQIKLPEQTIETHARPFELEVDLAPSQQTQKGLKRSGVQEHSPHQYEKHPSEDLD